MPGKACDGQTILKSAFVGVLKCLVEVIFKGSICIVLYCIVLYLLRLPLQHKAGVNGGPNKIQ